MWKCLLQWPLKYFLLLSLPPFLPPPFLPFSFSPSFTAFFPNYPISIPFLLVFWAIAPEITLLLDKIFHCWSPQFESLKDVWNAYISVSFPIATFCSGACHLPSGSLPVFCSPYRAGARHHQSAGTVSGTSQDLNCQRGTLGCKWVKPAREQWQPSLNVEVMSHLQARVAA